jgi:hypothetical protein
MIMRSQQCTFRRQRAAAASCLEASSTSKDALDTLAADDCLVMQAPGVPYVSTMSAPLLSPVSAASDVALQYIAQLSGVIVRQKVKWMEEMTGFEQANKYKVMARPPNFSIAGQDSIISQLPAIWTMRERSDCCDRQLCGPSRAFTMEVLDNNNQLVMTFDRRFELSCYFPGFILNPQHLEVLAGSGHLLGSVVMHTGLCSCFVGDWEFAIKDSDSRTILYVSVLPCQLGPNCICEEWHASIFTPARERVGCLKNCWPGCGVRMCTKADNYEVNWDVPAAFSPVAKALTLGAMVLVDFVLFESRAHKRHNTDQQLDMVSLLR